MKDKLKKMISYVNSDNMVNTFFKSLFLLQTTAELLSVGDFISFFPENNWFKEQRYVASNLF